MNDHDLINRIRGHLTGKRLPAPVQTQQLSKAAEMIGFDLPPLLKSLYAEVANGGFGPGFGLLPLFSRRPHACDDEEGAINAYLDYREVDLDSELDLVERDSSWGGRSFDLSWPPQLIPFCEWGDHIRSCVDCSKPDLPVLRFDMSKSRKFTPEAATLAKWLEDWLGGRWQTPYATKA